MHVKQIILVAHHTGEIVRIAADMNFENHHDILCDGFGSSAKIESEFREDNRGKRTVRMAGEYAHGSSEARTSAEVWRAL